MSGYDEKLLGSAPATTKAERQQGYDAALLEKGPTPPPVTSPVVRSSHSRRAPSGPQYGAGPTLGNTPRDLTADPVYSKKLPFWRTRRGKVTIAVVAFLIVAIIAGVVGGVVGSRKGSSDSSAPLTGASLTNTLATPTGSPTSIPQDSSPTTTHLAEGSRSSSGTQRVSEHSISGSPVTVVITNWSGGSPIPVTSVSITPVTIAPPFTTPDPNGPPPNNPNGRR